MTRARLPLIAGNWKMFKTPSESGAFAQELKAGVPPRFDREVTVFPTSICLPAVADVLRGTAVSYGGQNVHWEKEGAFTGEVQVAALVELGCRYVLVGHSERRTRFGETDEACNLKVRAVTAAGLAPVLCCGETLDQRERNETFGVLQRQLDAGAGGLSAPAGLVIAYEPVWAIGTGRNATPNQVVEIHVWIRKWLTRRFGPAADSTRVVYGGSVRPDGIDALMAEREVDGVLVGGASLDIGSFLRIVDFA